MYTNTSATIYAKTKTGEYLRTMLDAVFWDGSQGTRYSQGARHSQDALFVAIPFSVETGKKYLPPKEWERAGMEDAKKHWTLKPGDLIVKGECPYLHSPESPIGILTSQYDNVYTITLVDTADFGSEDMQHWEVSGK